MKSDGWKLIAMCLVAACGFFVLPLKADGAAGAKPETIPEATRQLLGLYQGDGGRFLVRERDGVLEMLFEVEPGGGEAIKDFTIFPLREIAGDVYRLIGDGPGQVRRETVRFTRDAAGDSILCQVGDRRFARKYYGPETGGTFKISPLLPAASLLEQAAGAVPPVEKGPFLPPDLVEIVSLDPSIKLDIRYATDNNFMGVALYDEGRAFLQRQAAEALVRVHRKLASYGYGLVVHDAYRPWKVTKMFWDATPDSQKDFVADPARGSRHNRGGAVDVSLFVLKTGRPAAMTSGYDEFSPRAYADFPGGTARQRERRDLLRILMTGEGFTVNSQEWWHFDHCGWSRYPILNIPFNEIM